MALLADYHTHTKYSRNHHGKGTIEENVRVAYEKGLRQIAITDHGFNQKLYGVRRKDIPKVRAEIEDAKERYPIDVLLGVEANLISSQGDIDIIPEKYMKLYMLNPMTSIINIFRSAFFSLGNFELNYYLFGWGITLIILFIGIILFNRVEKTFMDTV